MQSDATPQPQPRGARGPRRRFYSKPWYPDSTLLYETGKLLCRLFTTLYFDLKVYGLEHVPDTGGVLLVSNHQSVLDPVLICVRIPRAASYMARATLFKNRVFGWLITNLNAFPVQQGKGDTGAVKEAIARLKEGRLLTIFPEGHRTLDGQLQPIQAGVSLLIRRATNVTIVPVVVDGAYKSWPKGGGKLPRPVPIRVLYGPPLQVEGLKGEALTQLIDRTFRRLLADLRARGAEHAPY